VTVTGLEIHEYDSVCWFLTVARTFRQVETIGDCYVAVAGLPDPRADHALVMAQFANDCVKKMAELVKALEVSLGPDTGDLS
jgi:class 3 adenylate cyclase